MADSVSLSPNLISWMCSVKLRNTRYENRGETYADGDGVVFIYNRHYTHRQQFLEGINGIEVPRALSADEKTR